ncbi:MAG: hypothetical protein A2583_01185 [Bdellovibrionales bacterium RIFOXYD1_FULL_53_11]|nr:MAG: hypothetical protein A2583_01185 [Bdellovibrionales bacterium RIFOXYD1_FULL_53_11]
MSGASRKALLALSTAVCLFFSFQLLFFHALHQPYFVDEMLVTQSSFNFFTHGNYTFSFWRLDNRWFAPGVSVGIASSWASYFGWILGRSLLWARMASVLYCFALFMVAAVLAARRLGIRDKWMAVAFGSLAWLALFRLVPYSFESALYSLGELSGGIILAIGFMLLEKHPRAGSVLLGICVWHTKMIYLPFALVGMFALYPARGLRGVGRCLLWFMLPQAAWLVMVWIMTGWKGLGFWISYRLFFIHKRGNAGLDRVPEVSGFFERLARLEWSGYIPGRKYRLLLLVVLPQLLLLWLVIKEYLAVGRRLAGSMIFKAGMLACMAVFSAWYFFWHPFMWIRHIEPALLAGFGVIAWYFASVVLRLRGFFKKAVYGGVLALALSFALAAGLLTKTPEEMVFLGAAYPRQDYSRSCRHEQPWKTGPRDTLACDTVTMVECKGHDDECAPESWQ